MTSTRVFSPLRCAFGPLVIRYDERVLTPRPWTLLQSRWAAELAAEVADGAILELCAGAGQIGLVAAVLTGRPLVQVEADQTACHYARTNATWTGWADQVEVRHAGIDSALAPGERFPIVLADPPYLPTGEIASWPADPTTAIDGGADGLDLVGECLCIANEHLQPGGVLLLQVAGEAQADAVSELVDASADLGLTWRETRHHDRERAVMLFGAGPAATC